VEVRVPAGLVEGGGQRCGEPLGVLVGHVEVQQRPSLREARGPLLGREVAGGDSLDLVNVQTVQLRAGPQALRDQRAGGH
jgi:hypothetical protein